MNKIFTKEDTLLVKGIAILFMLFYHLFETYERVNSLGVIYAPLSEDVFLMISGFGNICVAVFAFLSAYGISKKLISLEAADLRSWYKVSVKRYLKLLVGFLCIYASVTLLWFYKFDYVKLYGKGWQGVLCGILDALGLAQVAGTPTLCETWWYMEIAILIIFITPILLKVVKSMGNYSIIVGVLLPLIVELPFDFKRYYFVILLGVVAANEEWFEKADFDRIPKWARILMGIVIFVALVIIRQNYFVYNNFAYLLDGAIAVFFAWFIKELLGGIPGVKQALRFLGKNSMNIYFIHSFIYMIIYQEFIYSFRYAGLIFAVLLVICLVYSICLEGIKNSVIRIVRRKDAGAVK